MKLSTSFMLQEFPAFLNPNFNQTSTIWATQKLLVSKLETVTSLLVIIPTKSPRNTRGGGIPRGFAGQGVKLNTTHLHLGPKLRTGEAIHQPAQNIVTASRRQLYLLTL